MHKNTTRFNGKLPHRIRKPPHYFFSGYIPDTNVYLHVGGVVDYHVSI